MKRWVLSVLCMMSLLSGVALRGREQIELCMIGDSITWAGDGDHWRKFLVRDMPELAFVGTHTACLGYSHAGEGGNSTGGVLRRINDLSSIPQSRNYHVLIGVNSNAAARCDADVERVAASTKGDIVKIVRTLESRPGCGRVFLGSLLPCSHPTDPQPMKYRDLANQATNRLLRRDFKALFPSGKVIWVEYEPSLRALPNWRSVVQLHPTIQGYEMIAKMLVPYLRKHAVRTPLPAGKAGVRVENLWSDKEKKTVRGVIPGWYILSFKTGTDCENFSLTVETVAGKKPLRHPFKKVFTVKSAKAGQRLEFLFFTGYEGYGYSQGPMAITAQNCPVSEVQLEKMRPTRTASVYGPGSFVDAVSPMSPGELRVSAVR